MVIRRRASMDKPVDVARRYDKAFNARDMEARMACLRDDAEVTLPGGMVARGRDQSSLSHGLSGKPCRM
jgi:hypothetical protein